MAQKVSPHAVKYFGSPWSAPAWMKTTKQLNRRGTLIGQAGGKYYQSFAKYIVKFIQEYHKNNVSLWGLTVTNELQNPNYVFNGMEFTSTSQRDYVKLDLGPELGKAGFGDVKVMIFDDNLPHIEEYASTCLTDKEAAKYTAGIAFHWYHNKGANRSVLDRLAKHFPNQFLLATEACDSNIILLF